jgi:hypothetical protein
MIIVTADLYTFTLKNKEKVINHNKYMPNVPLNTEFSFLTSFITSFEQRTLDLKF